MSKNLIKSFGIGCLISLLANILFILTFYAHGTDANAAGKFTGNYAITFGLYSNNDFRWYTGDISRVNSSAFASDVVSTFYACRTGNNFKNGNFAQSWANKTQGEVYAYTGANGRSQYSDINGTWAERHGVSILSNQWKQWYKKRGEVDKKPGAAWRAPVASYATSMSFFAPKGYVPSAKPGPAPW